MVALAVGFFLVQKWRGRVFTDVEEMTYFSWDPTLIPQSLCEETGTEGVSTFPRSQSFYGAKLGSEQRQGDPGACTV